MLKISAKTVIVHQTNIFDKLGIGNRSELLRFALSWDHQQDSIRLFLM
jgi:DNA-binding CsgD family transcriptional regulator